MSETDPFIPQEQKPLNPDNVLSGNAGLAGLQSVLNGRSARRKLRREVQGMMRPGYGLGPFHLTRAKFKPGRKLLAYFTFPAFNGMGHANQLVHLAVAWQNNLDGKHEAENWGRLQEEAERSGLMPVQCDLWRYLPDQGVKLELWPFDPKFPQLIRLGNPSYAANMFKSLGIVHDPENLPVITPIRYRPGERHVLRYEMDPPKAGPLPGRRLYAKLYPNAQDAARAFGIANRVADWLDAHSLGLQGNRPVAIHQEDGVILYPHAPGVPLSRLLNRSRRWLAAQLQIIGRTLVTLHGAPESLQAGLKQNSFVQEAKVVKRASEHIQVLLPETHAKILEIVETAQERYLDLPQEEPTFTHSDFKSDHVLSTSQGLTLIDFDTCTLTDPAMDIGKFLADLEWWFTLKGIPRVEEVQAELLKGYLAGGGPDDLLRERLVRARLFHVLILVKIAARRVLLYRKNWDFLTDSMIERAGNVLREALEA